LPESASDVPDGESTHSPQLAAGDELLPESLLTVACVAVEWLPALGDPELAVRGGGPGGGRPALLADGEGVTFFTPAPASGAIVTWMTSASTVLSAKSAPSNEARFAYARMAPPRLEQPVQEPVYIQPHIVNEERRSKQ
jgi:hypothetical protein